MMRVSVQALQLPVRNELCDVSGDPSEQEATQAIEQGADTAMHTRMHAASDSRGRACLRVPPDNDPSFIHLHLAASALLQDNDPSFSHLRLAASASLQSRRPSVQSGNWQT